MTQFLLLFRIKWNICKESKICGIIIQIKYDFQNQLVQLWYVNFSNELFWVSSKWNLFSAQSNLLHFTCILQVKRRVLWLVISIHSHIKSDLISIFSKIRQQHHFFSFPIRAAPIKEVFLRFDNIHNISKSWKQGSGTLLERGILHVYQNIREFVASAKMKVGSFQNTA